MTSSTNKTTKQKIFEAAIDLFSRYGYSGVSIRDITRKVGIKESSLYNHYSGKDEILTAIFNYYQGQLHNMFPPEKDVRDMVNRYPVDTVFERLLKESKFYGNNPFIEKIYRIVTMEQYHNERARDIMLYEMDELPLKFIEKVIKILIENNIIKDVDTKHIAMQYFYVLQALVSKYIIFKNYNMGTDEVEEKMQENIKYIFKTIRK